MLVSGTRIGREAIPTSPCCTVILDSNDFILRKQQPLTAQQAGQWPGDNSHSSDKARDEDCRRTVALKQILAASDRCRANAQSFSIAFEQGPAAVNADSESEIIAHRGSTNSNQNDVRKPKMMLRVSQEAGQEQHGFSGHRQPCVLQQQGTGHGSIAIVREKAAEQIKNVLCHSEVSWRPWLKEFDHSVVELVRNFLIRQVADALKHYQTAVLEILAQASSGQRIYGGIRTAPNKQRRNMGDARQHRFQLPQILGPGAQD